MLAYPPTFTTTPGLSRPSKRHARAVAHIIFGTKVTVRQLSRRCRPTTSSRVNGVPVGGTNRVSIPCSVPT